MVALQFLVLPVLVRVQVRQRKKRSVPCGLDLFCVDGDFRYGIVIYGRIVINLCLSIEIAEAEDEKFGVVDAVEFSPERLDFGID